MESEPPDPLQQAAAATAPPNPPPILPAALSSAPPLLPGCIPDHRLHPLTLLFTAWGAIRGLLLPMIIVLVFGRKQAMDNYVAMGAVFLVIPLAVGVARYFTFIYRVENGELIIRHGVLRRTHRVIPLNRVQDIRIEQSPLHRIFGVAELYVETAGGQGAEATLSVLARPEADSLRQALYATAEARPSTGASVAETPQMPEREIVRQLQWHDLVLAGITSNQMASLFVLLFFAWGFVDDFIPEETYGRFVEHSGAWLTSWYESAGAGAWAGIALTFLGLLLAGMLFSVIGSIVMFHGFTLSRSGEDLHRTYGLLTRRSSSLPRRRIQVLKIEETLLRRIFRLATLRADTAASKAPNQQGTNGQDVLLPVIPTKDLTELMPVFFPELPAREMTWNRVSRRAIRRGMLKGSLACIILAGVSWAVQQHLWALWPLVLLPFIYWVNLLDFRHYGYWFNRDYFSSRRGWLRRNTHIVPIANIQALVIRQTPFDRRHKVATLLVDTAGQTHTGGAPKLENVPCDEAVALARTMAKQAASTRYRV